MNWDLFLAAVFISVASSAVVYALLASRIRRGAGPARIDDGEFDLTPVESRLADLVTDMNRVANSHTKAIADRRDELKRAIEMANDRIRRLNTMLADLAILEQRLREPGRGVLEEPPAGLRAPVGPATPLARSGGSAVEQARPEDTVVEDARFQDPGPEPRDSGRTALPGGSWPAANPGGAANRGIAREARAGGGAWVFEVPGPVDGQERARDIESMAAAGLSPAVIASRLRLPLHAVERAIEERRRH